MSAVVVVTPLVIASWPVITAAISAAIGTLGFSIVQSGEPAQTTTRTRARAEIDVEDSEILADTGGLQEELVVERDGLRAVFSRDERGALKLCMEGEGFSKAQLREIGEELIGRVTQQFVYHRVMTELKERHMNVVGEEMTEDRTIKIRVRNL
ncbi:MAG: hypothetical protein ACRELG_03095 [Gemmataceae bacterium]